MNHLIACCGLDCEKCDARTATLTGDAVLREKTAALWTQLNGVTITPDMIFCTGCRAEGVKTPFCDSLCSIRSCVREKKLKPVQTAEKWMHAPYWEASPAATRRHWKI